MVRIWRVSLDDPLPPDPALSTEEQQRADRLRSARDAHRFRVAHWALRALLADVTGETAAALRFRNDARGKPHLVGHPEVAFNLSHSDGVGLVAILRSAEGPAPALGVDVEVERPIPELRILAASHFAEEEQAALWSVPDADRVAMFYRIWTRKEAFVKATGHGIGSQLASFAVSGDAGQARILRAQAQPDAPEGWTIHDLPLAPPYAGAVVIAAANVGMELRDWAPGRAAQERTP